VPLSPDAQDNAAFITRDELWKWKVLPFGLTSAPSTFQQLMEQVLSGLHWKTLLIYLEDVMHRIVKGILTKNIINFSQNVVSFLNNTTLRVACVLPTCDCLA